MISSIYFNSEISTYGPYINSLNLLNWTFKFGTKYEIGPRRKLEIIIYLTELSFGPKYLF